MAHYDQKWCKFQPAALHDRKCSKLGAGDPSVGQNAREKDLLQLAPNAKSVLGLGLDM